MISQGISVPWIFSDEFIHLDFSRIKDSPTITQTIDVLRKSGEVRAFNVESKWLHNSPNHQLILTYTEANNREFQGEGYTDFWGEARIEINPNKNSGSASWNGKFTKEWDGEVTWTRINEQLTEEKKRERVSRVVRQQNQLRQALLVTDEHCAISGEKLANVLDAAHIISAAAGGREVIENAILLRADLHRLLDSGLISIGTNGAILIGKDLPDNYAKDLNGKRISVEILSRVFGAILHAEKLRHN